MSYFCNFEKTRGTGAPKRTLRDTETELFKTHATETYGRLIHTFTATHS